MTVFMWDPNITKRSLRFWSYNVIVAADIEKAFLMIDIKEGVQDVLRFFWIKDAKKRPPEVCAYRFT